MQVTAWNNGQHSPTGAGYGLKVGSSDRDRHFQRSWTSVFVSLPEGKAEVEVNIAKRSFWNDTCRELISRDLGRWLLGCGYAPWPRGQPPKFRFVPARDNHFRLELP